MLGNHRYLGYLESLVSLVHLYDLVVQPHAHDSMLPIHLEGLAVQEFLVDQDSLDSLYVQVVPDGLESLDLGALYCLDAPWDQQLPDYLWDQVTLHIQHLVVQVLL